MLPIKKLYIDSKARSKDSRSTSDFAIDLVESLTMPEHAVFQVCDVLIPHTWYLIDEHNCNIYFNEVQPLVSSGNFSIALDVGNYDGDSLAGEISKQIQAATTKIFKYAVNYDTSTGRIRITASIDNGVSGAQSQWQILTDTEVLQNMFFNISDNPKSLNVFLGNTTSQSYRPDDPFGIAYHSSRLQFTRIKYLFIRSANLGTFNTLGSFGERTIIKKVPVTAPQGEIILDDTRSGNDVLNCAKQTFKRLEFTITDEKGNIIDLNGHDTSFSLIFSII